LQDGVRDNAIKAYRGQRQPQKGEGSEEYRNESAPFKLRFVLDPALKVSNISSDLLVRINGCDLLPNAVKLRKWLALGCEPKLA
jgi:hypothetical protein